MTLTFTKAAELIPDFIPDNDNSARPRKFLAHYVPMKKLIGGIESSAGEYVVEFEAENKEVAEAYCAHNGLRYVKAMADS
jgi:hypothetical protein